MKESKAVQETETASWERLPWRKLEQHVYRIQKRIYRASESGNLKKVHNLQKLLTRSHAARLLATRRVTQDNDGKKTAGVDGVKKVEPHLRLELAEAIHPRQWKDQQVPPVRRVWIPKPGKPEKRPLGIPTMRERAKQALIKMGLEPQWEALFETRSHGFRPGRGCWDAIEDITNWICKKSKYVLDADIKGCFDNIDQHQLLEKLKTTSENRKLIKQWLKAGALDKETFAPTEAGTPQGGVISPLFANIALHGMQEEVESKVKGAALIRYADDFVVLHEERAKVEQAQEVVEHWLEGIGLHLSPTKTQIVHTLQTGFDFLGFNVRQYAAGKHRTAKGPYGELLGFKTLIKPSKESQKQHVRKMKETIRRLRGHPQNHVIAELNPIIKGWANYYRTKVSKTTFCTMDHVLWYQLYHWVRWNNPRKGMRHNTQKYWHTRNGRKWVFATEEATLVQHANVAIKRHWKVRRNASPYDGNWKYWARRLQDHPMLVSEKAYLLKQQKGKCRRCGLYFKDGDVVEVDHLFPLSLGGTNDRANKQALHRHCHDQKTAEDRSYRLLLEAEVSQKRPQREEPCEGKPSRTVLNRREEGRPSPRP